MTEEALALEEESVIPKVTALNYGRFLRRLVALAVDCLLMGAVGLLIVILLKDRLMDLGESGWVIGYIICAVYFTLSQGPLGRGQSLGMHLLDLRVIGKNGEPVSYGASFVRFIILTLPFFMAFWSEPLVLSVPPPGFQVLFAVFLLLMIGLPIGSGILVLLLPERRALHDFAAGAWVTEPGIVIGEKLTEEEAKVIIELKSYSPKFAWLVFGVVETLIIILLSSLMLFQATYTSETAAIYNGTYQIHKILSGYGKVRYPSLKILVYQEKQDNQLILKQDYLIISQVTSSQFENDEEMNKIRGEILDILNRHLRGAAGQKMSIGFKNGFELGIGNHWRINQMDYTWKKGEWIEDKDGE